MKNKLIPEIVRINQPDFPEYRHSGRSLGIAFEIIGKALQNPQTKFQIIDHYDSLEADRHTVNMIDDIICEQGLKYFKLYKENNKYFIEFNPFFEE